MTEPRPFELVVDGIDFGEGPRWHDDRLWYSDFHQRAIYAVDHTGNRTAVHEGLADRPSGLGWQPDGSLLVVAMTTRRVLREVDGALVEHADLSSIATGHCNDMVVDAAGNAYVGNFGFDLEARASFAPADVALVMADGTVSVAATGLGFPNGSVITPDGGTLIVGETFGGDYVAFTIADDATLHDRRQWAEIPGTAPDGCTLDADGAIWFADAIGSQLVRVLAGGEVTHRLPTPMPTYACALGGREGTTLYALCAPDADPAVVAGKAAGALYRTTVDVPHAGLP
jgi:sugar lactone lactonase YvrE